MDEVSITSVIAIIILYSRLVQLVERLAVNQDVAGSSPALGAKSDRSFMGLRRFTQKNHRGKWGDNREYEKCSLAHYFKFVPRCTSVSRALYATRSGRLSGRLQIYLDKFDSCALLQWETPSLYSQTVRVVRLLRRVEKQHFHSFFY